MVICCINIMATRTIDYDLFLEAVSLYWKWKELNSSIKNFYSRGVNLHEMITEFICCYTNGFLSSLGGGSEDAIDPKTNKLIQVKGTSNWDSDLTSFGPESKFDSLHFVRLNQDEDKMYLYDIPVDKLDEVMVNKNDSVKDFKISGKRPRFSIIKQYIIPNNLQPYAVVDLKGTTIVKFL